MKKFLLFSIALLIGMSFSFAQYELNVIWNAGSVNCNCGVGIDSTFKITVVITDIANEEGDEFDPIYTTADGSQYQKLIPVGFIEDYCAEYHDNTPVFYIRATVVLHCDDNPPFDACDGSVNHGPESCYTISQNDITINVGSLN